MSWILSAFADEAGDPIEQQIEGLQRAGIKHIDPRSIDGCNITQLPLDVAKSVQQKLAAAGISVLMYGSPIGKIDIADDFQSDLDRLTHLGRLADIFGAKGVRIFSYFNKQGQPMEQWQSVAIDRLRRLHDLADKLGLILYHENERHIFGDTSAGVLAIADALRGPAGSKPGSFRLIFDFDNYNRTGENLWDIWLKMRDRTDAFHLKDSNEDGYHVPVGQGKGKVREILKDARARQWQGPLTLEPHLRHSKAVVATHVSGQANPQYSQMPQAEVFQAAAQAANSLLKELGAPMA